MSRSDNGQRYAVKYEDVIKNVYVTNFKTFIIFRPEIACRDATKLVIAKKTECAKFVRNDVELMN